MLYILITNHHLTLLPMKRDGSRFPQCRPSPIKLVHCPTSNRTADYIYPSFSKGNSPPPPRIMRSILAPLLLFQLVFQSCLSQPTDNSSNPSLPPIFTKCPTLFTSQDLPPSPAPSDASLSAYPVSPNLAPYIAAVLKNHEDQLFFRCTASFVTPTTLLVPADCVQEFNGACADIDNLFLSTSPEVSGSEPASPIPPSVVPISNITAYPEHNCAHAVYNIALISIGEELPETRSVTLSNNASLPTELSVTRTVAFTKGSENIRRKSQIDLPILSQTQCRTNYETFGTDTESLDLDAQVCVGDSDRGLECIQICPAGGILIQYDPDNKPVMVGMSAYKLRSCDDNSNEQIFLRTGHYIDWIRDNVPGGLSEAGDVRQQTVPFLTGTVPEPEIDNLNDKTSGMLVGAIIVAAIVLLVGVIAAVSSFRRWRRQRSGNDFRSTRHAAPKTAEEIFEQMELEMSNMSTTEASASSLYPSRGVLKYESGSVGSLKASGSVRAPYASGNLTAPHASRSEEAPYASGSVGGPYVGGSVGAPDVSGSVGAPYASGGVGASYASGSVGVPYASGSMGAPYARGSVGANGSIQSGSVRGAVQKHPIRISDAVEP
eukprot:GFKZ01000739.1.p1 GENE.GFKZ01000739.1~~GFKZ01000739.1.p1  ORF type:complete len:603 (-),score=44.51 GFKZ01000739.1:344-2152(-)